MNTNGSALVVDTPAPDAATNAAQTTLHDIKAPVEIPDYLLVLLIVLGVLVLAVIIYLIWKYWLKAKLAPKPILPLEPHVRAKRKLREAMTLINEPEPFTIFVSGTIRVYLEERFDFRAPERTTEEFLYELQSTNLLTADQKKSLGEFLSRCDLIKFAKYDPTKPELEELHQSALSLVEETEPSPMAPAMNPAIPPATSETVNSPS